MANSKILTKERSNAIKVDITFPSGKTLRVTVCDDPEHIEVTKDGFDPGVLAVRPAVSNQIKVIIIDSKI